MYGVVRLEGLHAEELPPILVLGGSQGLTDPADDRDVFPFGPARRVAANVSERPC